MTYWVPRLALLVGATAALFFLAFAVNTWGKEFRVFIGYAVSIGFLAVGAFVEKKHRDYARVLYSGGIIGTYFVTYAWNYLPFAKLVDNPYVAITCLSLVVAFWTGVTQWRQSRSMAFLVTALAHFTIFISGTQGPARNSVAAIVLLSAGSAFFLLKNRWYYVAAAGLVGSYLNHTIWMFTNEGSHLARDFWISMAFLTCHFVIFALAELFSHEEVRRQHVPTWFRTGFVTLNTAGYAVLGTLMCASFEFTRDHQDMFRLLLAGALLGLALAYLRVKKGDPLYNVYMTKAVAMATLGLAARYSGSTLSAWLAVEMVVLLVSARRSGLLVTRILALGLAVLALVHGLAGTLFARELQYGDPGYWTTLARGVIMVLSFLVASLFYQRTDWTTRSPNRLGAFWGNPGLLWRLGFTAERPVTLPSDAPPWPLFFPNAYALGGVLLFLSFGWLVTEPGHRLVMIALGALALTVAATGFNAKPFGMAALMLVVAALLFGATEITLAPGASDVASFRPDSRTLPMRPAGPASVVLALMALALVALASEKRFFDGRDGLAWHRQRQSPYFLYGVTAWLLGLLLTRDLGGNAEPLALAVAACVSAGLTLLLHRNALAAVSTALILWAHWRWLADMTSHNRIELGWLLTSLLMVGVPLGFDRFYAKIQRDTRLWRHAFVLVPASAFVAVCFVLRRVDWPWGGLALALVAYAYLGYALGCRSKVAGVMSVLVVTLGSFMLVVQTYGGLEMVPKGAAILGYTFCAAYWVLGERLISANEGRRPAMFADPRGLLVGLATALLVLMLGRVATYLTVSWALLAFGIFALAVVFRHKAYRYAGLAVLALALLRAYAIDALQLQGLARVGAFAMLTVVLLVVAFGYVKASQWLQDNEAETAKEDTPTVPENRDA